MKVLCILGRHRWRVDNSDPERPFEVCDRCGHYRNDDSSTSTYPGAGADGPGYRPPYMGGGGGDAGGMGGGGGDAGGM